MRRRKRHLEVSTFPFLAVLLCTMGALILLLLVLDRRAKIVALLQAKNEMAQLQAGKEQRDQARSHQQAEDERLAQERKAEWLKRSQELHALLAQEEQQVVGQIEEAADQLAAATIKLQTEAERAEQEKKLLQIAKARLVGTGQTVKAQQEAAANAEQQTAAAKRELERQAIELAQLEQTLAGMKALRERQKNTYSLVPYLGRRGDNRRPVYVECGDTAVIFHPDKVVLEGMGLTGPRLRAEVEKRIAQQRDKSPVQPGKDKSRPYLLMLVRPNGIVNYYRTQEALAGMDIDFGYEFIEPDWVLDFSAEDNDAAAQPWMTAAKLPAQLPVSAAPVPRPSEPGGGLGMTIGGASGRPPASPEPLSASPERQFGGNQSGTHSQGDGWGNGFGNGPTPASGGGGGFQPGTNGQPGTGNPGGGGAGSPNSASGQGGMNSQFGGFGNGGAWPGIGGGGGFQQGTSGQPGTGYPGGGGAGSPNGSSGPGGTNSPSGVKGNGGASPGTGGGGGFQPGTSGHPGTGYPGGGGAGSPNGPSGPGGTNSSSGGNGNGGAGPGTGGGGGFQLGTSGQPGTGYTDGASARSPNGASGSGGPGGGGNPGTATSGTPGSANGAQQGNGQGPSSGSSASNGATSQGGPGNGSQAGSGNGAGSAISSDGQATAGSPTPGDANSPAGGSGSSGGGGNGASPSGPPPKGGSGGDGNAAWQPAPAGGSPFPSGGGSGGSSTGSAPFGSGIGASIGQPIAASGKAVPAPPPLGRILGNRDWLIYLECNAEGLVVKQGNQKFSVELLAAPTKGEHPLVQAVRQMVARRQATIREGEPPYRPQLRFQVRTDGLRTYYLAYPLLDSLRLPMSRENVESPVTDLRGTRFGSKN
jgi:hypothetical protein